MTGNSKGASLLPYEVSYDCKKFITQTPGVNIINRLRSKCSRSVISWTVVNNFILKVLQRFYKITKSVSKITPKKFYAINHCDRFHKLFTRVIYSTGEISYTVCLLPAGPNVTKLFTAVIYVCPWQAFPV